MKAKHILTLATLSVMPSMATPASAAGVTYTWNLTAGTQNWSAGWTPVGVPAAGDNGIFPSTIPGNLAINLDVPAVIGTLTFGSAGGFTTDIGNSNTSFTNPLLFDNTGGIGNPAITSVGTGSNIISAPVQLGGNLEIAAASTRNLTISGPITPVGAQRNINNLSLSATLTLSGQINLADTTNAGRGMVFNGTSAAQGDLVLSGNMTSAPVSSGSSTNVTFGLSNDNAVLAHRSRILITGDNSLAVGTTWTTNRQDITLGSDTAFGAGSALLQLNGGTTSVGTVLLSDNDARTIKNPIRLTQAAVVAGDHSLTLNGTGGTGAGGGGIACSANGRPLANLLTAGHTLTLGKVAAGDSADSRTFIIDGDGKTLITGGIYNAVNSASDFTERNPAVNIGGFEKRGSGILVVSGTSTYAGATRVRGGLMEFATAAAYGATTGIRVEQGSAVGLATGSLDPTFLSKIAVNTAAQNDGVLALASADSATPINYAAGGNLSAAGLQNLGLGAVSAGATYASAITPAGSTYRLGGGGTLTLSNPSGNQLTGANSVVLSNGGTVVLNGTNNYTGSTTVGGTYILPTAELMRQGQVIPSQISNVGSAGLFIRGNSTLSVNSLANGGVDSSIGNSSNAASNLLLNGGTLRYTGAVTSTDRLFTIQPNGATLDASGTGAVAFTNTGAIVSADTSITTGTISGSFLTVADGKGLTPGMTVTGTGIAAGTTVISVQYTGSASAQVTLSAAGTAGTPTDLVFGNQNRTLSLTGTSTAANTLSGSLSNSATGTLGLAKSGAGQWVLSGSNTYTGSTTVTAGTLTVGTANSLPGGSAVTVGGGATTATVKLGGGFTQNLSSLTFAGNGRFDVGTGTLLNNNGGGATALAAARALVVSGFAGGTWAGPGYVTSSADAKHGVGYKDTGTAIQVKYTLYGDADLDGGVSINDFNALAANFGQASGKVWVEGDFDYDGGVSINDFNLLASNFGTSLPAGSEAWAGLLAFAEAHNDLQAFQAVTGVPEPTTLGLLAVGATFGLRRRQTR